MTSEYIIPEGMTEDEFRKKLANLVRPCSPGIIGHMATLETFKPLGDSDRIKIVFDRLYDDLQPLPEVAVVMALEELRQNEEHEFFPLRHIKPLAQEYQALIMDVTDYFNQGEK